MYDLMASLWWENSRRNHTNAEDSIDDITIGICQVSFFFPKGHVEVSHSSTIVFLWCCPKFNRIFIIAQLLMSCMHKMRMVMIKYPIDRTCIEFFLLFGEVTVLTAVYWVSDVLLRHDVIDKVIVMGVLNLIQR